MLRVLHCIYDDPKNPWVGGGGAHRVAEIYRRLAGQVDVTVATGNFPGARAGAIGGVRYLRLGASFPYPLSRWTYTRKATKLLSTAEYDVAVYDFSVYTPIRLPTNRRVAVIIHMLHGPTATERWGPLLGVLVQQMERRLLRQARWVSTTSRWMLQQLRPVLSLDARVFLIGSGVSEEFARVRRAEAGFLLYYGRFDLFHKGLDTLLKAFAVVLDQQPELELRIAGQGKDRERIGELARELGVQHQVRVYPGITRQGVLELFSGALALLMPSRLEGLPMVPAEAMAAGVPVVAASVGAVAEVVDPPRGGILVSPDDPEGLASAVGLLLHDRDRRAKLSVSARESARRFSWDAVAEQHLAFLREVAADAHCTPSPTHNPG